jgi:hypothetical protein
LLNFAAEVLIIQKVDQLRLQQTEMQEKLCNFIEKLNLDNIDRFFETSLTAAYQDLFSSRFIDLISMHLQCKYRLDKRDGLTPTHNRISTDERDQVSKLAILCGSSWRLMITNFIPRRIRDMEIAGGIQQQS